MVEKIFSRHSLAPYGKDDDIYGGLGNDLPKASGDGDPDNVFCGEGTDTPWWRSGISSTTRRL
jgi:hypothetical protein